MGFNYCCDSKQKWGSFRAGSLQKVKVEPNSKKKVQQWTQGKAENVSTQADTS